MKIKSLVFLIVLTVVVSGCITGQYIPTEGQLPGTSFTVLNNTDACTSDGKPIIRLYSTTWCPHCKWVKETFDSVANEYALQGKIAAYHWELDTGDNTLSPDAEGKVPDSEMHVFSQFNPRGSIPTFVFGCKYYRIGTGYEGKENGLESEAADFRAVIEALLQ